jgi:hypothetical protein
LNHASRRAKTAINRATSSIGVSPRIRTIMRTPLLSSTSTTVHFVGGAPRSWAALSSTNSVLHFRARRLDDGECFFRLFARRRGARRPLAGGSQWGTQSRRQLLHLNNEVGNFTWIDRFH